MAALTTKEDIANAALVEIGEKTITLFTDSTDRAKVVNQHYDATLDEVLADTFWGFAKKYRPLAKSSPQPPSIPGDFTTAFELPSDFIRPVRLENNAEFDIFSSFATIATQTPTLSSVDVTVTTSAAHGLAIGDFIILTSGSQKDEIREVTAVPSGTTATIEESFTADQVAGTTWTKAVGSKTYLITSNSTIKLEYIARITDPKLWSPLFIQAIVKRLASKFALAITHSRTLSVSLLQEYSAVLENAETVAGQSANRPRKIESDVLTVIRKGGQIRNDKVLVNN
jgi:hypothetical protein